MSTSRRHSHTECLQTWAATNQAHNADIGECNAVANADFLQVERPVADERSVVNVVAVFNQKYLRAEKLELSITSYE